MLRKFLLLFFLAAVFAANSALAQSDVSALEGTWIFTASTPNGDQSARLLFEEDENGWSGKIIYIGPELQMPLTDVSFEANVLVFTWDDPDGGENFVDGIIKGDEFEGTAVVGGNELPVTGTRQKSSE
jgi:hypothetical protein